MILLDDRNNVREYIRKRYTEIAIKGSERSGCCSPNCCDNSSVNVREVSKNIGYSEDELENAPVEANMGLGCGNPIAIASLKEGEIIA